jgi:enamine deaminase RidA (YjgF/YER057c/UK114 family)
MIGKYLIFEPEANGKIGDEWRQCLKQIIYRREPGFKLIKLNVFVNVADYSGYLKVRSEIGKSIHDAFGDQCPAYNVTAHPPEGEWKISVEAGYTDIDISDVSSGEWNSIPYVICITDVGKELWVGGLGSGLFPTDTRKAAESAFEQMKSILEKENMTLNHLVRQWNYIGNILEIKNDFQNYQVFNEVRSEYYQKYRNVRGYPAATGIGMKLGGVSIDFCAVMTNETVQVKPIENPNQVNAYEYGQQVLKGLAGEGKTLKHPPQFERALLITRKIKSTLFVSGTASIIGQETIGIDDVEKQTEVTIENIYKLTDQKRIGNVTSNNDIEWGRFILIRTYVKDREDFNKVRAICIEKFPDVQQIFVESDICRDNLLVEIEAEFSINN